MTTAAGRKARSAGQSPLVEWLGRFGLAAKGVSFGIVAVLALEVAAGHGGKATDRQGALRSVAGHAFGRVLLVLLAIGFAGYALWRFAQAFLDRDGEGEQAKGLAKRAGFLARGAIYVGLLVTTVRILAGSGSSSGNGEQKATAGVLGWPAGTWLVGAAGLAVIGAGLFNGYRGVARKFMKQLDEGSMGQRERRFVVSLGVLGHVARMVVFCLVGAFLVRAALQYDPSEAIGLDGALRKVARESYGTVLLGLVAGGLLAYGLFCLVQARYRRI